MKKVKVSIIVPIYNVEKYIKECLDSLENQSLKEIEVIMIDDGSKDNSGIIAENYSNKNSKFIYIKQNNKGLGGARNTGLNHAKGEYITFLDSDDKFDVDACLRLYNEAIKNDCDIVFGRPMWFYGRKLKKTYIDDIYIKKFTRNEIYKKVSIVTSQLIKRSLFTDNNIKFVENMTAEDIPMSLLLQKFSKKISVIDDIVYLRRERDDESNKSITQQYTLKILEDRLKCIRFLSKINVSFAMRRVKNKKIFDNIYFIKTVLNNLDNNNLNKGYELIKNYFKIYNNDMFLKLSYQYILENKVENKVKNIILKVVIKLLYL